MNYRHAFHAGNFADVFKHVILVRALCHLRKKNAPFRFIDAHAGIGFYDLSGEEAQRTGEWRDGVGQLDEPLDPAAEILVAPYRTVLDDVRRRHGQHVYPGSPLVARELLRRQDRGILVELHPADGALLAERFNAVPNLKVLRLDGWTALHGLIPPKERRGLVLIDPPYEARDEFGRLTAEIARAVTKWPTGVFLAWYPIKVRDEIDHGALRFGEAVTQPTLRLELMVERPDDPTRLNGCGLFVINPPWTLRDEAETILPALANRLARRGYGTYRCDWLREPPNG
jgi:23S rRNA (adenine2030-N6)-methyltransferase